MKKLLILLTSVYPTNKGDMFVHEELKHLEGVFDKILIFPVNNTAKLESRVEIQSPSELHLTNRRGTIAARLRDLLYMISAFMRRTEQTRTEAKTRAKGLRQHLYLYFSTGRAEQLLRDCRPIIRQAIEDETYDRVVVYSYWMSIPAIAALKIGQDISKQYPNQNLKIYSRGHGYDIYDEASATGFQPYRRALIEEMDALFPCSQYGVDYMQSRYLRPGEASPIYLARLGVADPLTERELDWLDIEKQRSTEAGTLSLVSCSRVIPLKRLNLLVEALSLLKEKNVKLSWTHFGDGPDIEDLRQTAESKLGFMDWSIRGHVPNTEIMDFYCHARADLFLNVSSSEGVPVSVMEALAAGIPIVATDVGGTAEVVLPERGSTLLSANVTAAEIAVVLESYAAHTAEQRTFLSRDARAVWAEYSDSEKNYRQMSEIIAGINEVRHVPYNED